MPVRIAMVTWQGLPDLADDDRLVADELVRRGHAVEPFAWDGPAVDWRAFDAVILRSCWDYHLRLAEFLAWLDAADRKGVRLWNPPHVARWNAHKGYLLDLERAGCAIVPTVLLPRGDRTDLSDLIQARGWASAVVKPAVAASAFGAHRIRTDDVAYAQLEPWQAAHDLLVQPFLHEIADNGEWSLMFIGGEFSHAIRKRPGSGDFRVQHELGGSMEAVAPPDAVLAAARAALRAAPGPWLYARVDGVLIQTGFLLMELEMLEPSLFLDRDDAASGRFADAIERAATE